MHLDTNKAISQFLFITDKPTTTDLIFVLGSEYFPKMDIAIKLYKQGYAPKIFISGGAYQGKDRVTSESFEFAQYAISKGVPKSAIIIEEKSTNTKENFIHSKSIIARKLGWNKVKKITFICHAFHTRRVLMTAHRHWPANLKYYFAPVIDDRKIGPNNWWKSEVAKHRVYGELERIGKYALQDDIS
ncbi:MAG: YdcF family protein [Patescibacteria group bacterium]